ncbi:MAG: hypothetical protein ACLVJ6_14350 [Merdibacter sp.]
MSTASLLEDSCGPKLSDGRCFWSARGRLVHFSEHAQGCHYFDLDGAQTDRLSLCRCLGGWT